MADARTPPIEVLGIAGSLRASSFNAALLRAAVELAPPAMRIRQYDLRELPLYDADLDAAGAPPSVVAFKQAIADADALLIATPEYNYSVPGVLKNAIDWASRPARGSVLTGKPAAIMGAATGMSGTIRAQLHLRQIFLFTETYVMLKPQLLIAHAASHFDGDGRLTDQPTRDVLRHLLESLLVWAARFPKQAASPG